jgi:hypothetical protein
VHNLAADTLLLDEYMPAFDHTRSEHRVIDARPAFVYETMRNLDMLAVRSPLLDAALFIRGLPARFQKDSPPPPPSIRLADLFDRTGRGLEGWIPLAEERGREMAFGTLGRFWEPNITWRTVPPDEFASFAQPGWGKIAASLSARPYGGERSIASYEARTSLTDEESRIRFGRYWRMVSPFVGVMMRALLADVGRRAP